MTANSQRPGTSAIPIAVQDGQDYGVGTAFVLTRDGQEFLTTAAHVFTHERSSSTRWNEWPESLFICTAADTQAAVVASVEVFDHDADGNRFPRFHYLHHPQTAMHMIDLIMIPLVGDEPWASQFMRIDLQKTSLPTSGDIVTGWGYKSSNPEWPSLTSIRGPVIQALDRGLALLTVQMVSEDGISGGPVFTVEGNFAGMVVGQDESVAQVIPPGFFRQAKSNLGGHLWGVEFDNF